MVTGSSLFVRLYASSGGQIRTVDLRVMSPTRVRGGDAGPSWNTVIIINEVPVAPELGRAINWTAVDPRCDSRGRHRIFVDPQPDPQAAIRLGRCR